MRGILGEKIGMTQVFDDDARVVPVTVLRVAGCRVGQVKSQATDGYDAVQLCFGTIKPTKSNNPQNGHARKYKIQAPRRIVELRIEPDDKYEPGQSIAADMFEVGDKVDVIGVSKGKGFAGVMKRHNFSGQCASHGVHRVHRHGGAIGMCATPSRVIKGMRMAGHMGHERVTIANLTVVAADPEREIILIKGAVPGPRGGLVMVKDPAKGPCDAPESRSKGKESK